MAALLAASSRISSISLTRSSLPPSSSPSFCSRTAPRCGGVIARSLLQTDVSISRDDSVKTMAGAVFAAMANASSASAAQELMNIAAATGGEDNRGLALLLPLVPAIGWVLFNILKPGLNQLERMKSAKGVVVGAAGIGAMMLAMAPEAEAAEASGDSRGLLLLFALVPALAWVLFNILQPALNQLDKMRLTKGVVVGAAGFGAASELLHLHDPSMAHAAQMAEIAAASGNTDSRGTLLLAVLIPAIAWVLFNILRPALNQFDKMRAQK